MPPAEKIKAIYLRKSRDETGGAEDVLANHRFRLVSLCEKNGWKYKTYEEIGSASSLTLRPQMMTLLDDIEHGLYDAVIVMDIDRLTRGDQYDWAYIQRVLHRTNTKIILENGAVRDFRDSSTQVMAAIEGALGQIELSKIVTRFHRGKTTGVMKGRWTQGIPPWPYVYHAESKSLKVDQEQLPHYLMAKEMALAGVSPQEIAWKLNGLGVYGRRGKPWSAETMQRILLHPLHRGQLVYGKTRLVYDPTDPTSDEKIKEEVPEDDWIRGEGDHERLITADEQERIRALITSRRRLAPKARSGIWPLSGLVKCAKCGHTHSITRRKRDGKIVIQACPGRSPTGDVCGNGGMDAEAIYDLLRDALADQLGRLRAGVASIEQPTESKNLELDGLRGREQAIQERIDRITTAYIAGALSLDDVAKHKPPLEAELRTVRSRISAIESAQATGEMPPGERMARLEQALTEFLTPDDGYDEARNERKHSLLITLVDHIVLAHNRRLGPPKARIVWR